MYFFQQICFFMAAKEQPLAARQFAEELTEIVKNLIAQQQEGDLSVLNWKTKLGAEIEILTLRYWKCKPSPQFTVGDGKIHLFITNCSKITALSDASAVVDESADVEAVPAEVRPPASDVHTPLSSSSSLVSVHLSPPPEVATSIDDVAILKDLYTGKLKHRELESKYGPSKAVELRRKHMEELVANRWSLAGLPYKNYDYSWVPI
jgi:hypothetical protein